MIHYCREMKAGTNSTASTIKNRESMRELLLPCFSFLAIFFKLYVVQGQSLKQFKHKLSLCSYENDQSRHSLIGMSFIGQPDPHSSSVEMRIPGNFRLLALLYFKLINTIRKHKLQFILTLLTSTHGFICYQTQYMILHKSQNH